MKKKKLSLESIESLAVRYRPKRISEIIGNEHAKSIVSSFIRRKKLPRTWLFVGEPGSGKTTFARLLARIINCPNLSDIEPCLKCESCKLSLVGKHPDIIELNASSEEGGVDKIKQILEIARLVPHFGYRAIILDEVHGLTPKSKELLLKPLEEPSKRVFWFLCTTAPEKLPDAVYGRCQKIFLQYPSEVELKKFLFKVAKKEFPKVCKKIKSYLSDIVESASYQPREALTLLEEVGNVLQFEGEAKVENVLKVKTAGSPQVLAMKLLSMLLASDFGDALALASSIPDDFADLFVRNLINYATYSLLYLKKLEGNVNYSYDRRNFGYLSFPKWEKFLQKNRDTLILPRCLSIFFEVIDKCTSKFEAMKMGLISPKIIIFSIISSIMRENSSGV